jgi:hypothetical protein
MILGYFQSVSLLLRPLWSSLRPAAETGNANQKPKGRHPHVQMVRPGGGSVAAWCVGNAP